MYFSCKISNAVLSLLESRREDLSSLYELNLPPMELLRDPSGWLSAPMMEELLENLMKMDFGTSGTTLLYEAGMLGHQLRPWGVLDSVLRMMPQPQEVFNQPERFLSYFISPEPPIENVKRTPNELSFDLPLPAEQYPNVTYYLRSAFESLPLYIGQTQAKCEWVGIHIKLIWSDQQEPLFDKDLGHQVSPELLRTVIDEQQNLQRGLEEKNQEINRKNEEILRLKKDLSSALTQVEDPQEEILPEHLIEQMTGESVTSNQQLSQNLARLHDYMVRAQQLITVLTGMNKGNPAVRELLKRLDWEHVKTQYPRTIAESIESIRKIKSIDKQ